MLRSTIEKMYACICVHVRTYLTNANDAKDRFFRFQFTNDFLGCLDDHVLKTKRSNLIHGKVTLIIL